MDFKSLISQLDQLNEATEKTKTGLKHTAEPGGYGRKDDEDEDGNKIKDKSAEKKGKGRPKKATSTSGEDKKYDFSAFGVTKGKDVKLPKHDKKKTKKHSIKEYLDQMYEPLNEMGITVKPMPGASQIIGADGKPMGTADAATANTIKQASEKGTLKLGGDEEMKEGDIGKHNNATTGFDALVRKLTPKYGEAAAKRIAGSQLKKIKEGTVSDHPENQARIQKQFSSIPGLMDVWKKYKHLGDYGTNLQTTMSAVKKEFPRMDPKTLQSISTSLIYDNDPYSSTAGDAAFYAAKEIQKYLAGAQMKKIKEADQPPNDSLLSPMSEARAKADDKAEKAGKKVAKDIEYDEGHKGKDDNKAEKAGKKVTKDIEYDEKKKLPSMAHIKKMCQDGKSVAEICKMHPDCDQKELKQMVADCKETLDEASMPMKKVNGKSVPAFAADGKGKNDLTKKKVKEGMDHRLKAARHMGKAHALTKEGYNCRYDDMEESRHYHEGYKEGLDECYGQMPIQGYVGEANNEVADMASYGAHTPTMEDDMYEMDKTSYMKQQAIKTPGDTFKAFGQTFKDKEVVESPFAFEAWEKELNSILEGKDVNEGMTVSISKGQQGTPDSVSVSAQDAEADQLLSIIKQSGMGLFGGDDAGRSHTGQPMTVDVDGGEGPQANIEVVDDHDDMLSLIRKMTGQGPAQANGDYEEEGGHEDHGHEHGEDETCESCGGMMEEGHSCGEAVEEDESMDQREYEVAEDQSGGDDSEESDEVNSDATRDAALATAAGKNFADTDAPLEEGGDGGEASNAGAEGVDIADVADETEEDLEESLANGADDTFESDIDFMTKVISGGLNKQKSTGQTTIPVVSTQVNRLGSPMRESTDLLHDWRKLSGIK
jgi:hypothetical protein